MSGRPISALEVKLFGLIFPIFGVGFTVARLLLSSRTRRLWWDDALASVSAVFAIGMTVVAWLHYSNPSFLNRTTRVALYYCIAEFFYAALWLARISIIFSILRIIPESRTRTILRWSVVIFSCSCIALGCQIFWICENQPHWKDTPQPQCSLGNQAGVFQLLSSVFGDIILVLIPGRLLIPSGLEWGIKLRLMLIFSAAALTTIVSFVHAFFIFEGGGPREIIAGTVEMSVSLVVCNFVVVLPVLWRACGLQPGSDQESIQLTTVHFSPTSYARTHPSVANGDTLLTMMGRGATDVTSVADDQTSITPSNLPGKYNSNE